MPRFGTLFKRLWSTTHAEAALISALVAPWLLSNLSQDRLYDECTPKRIEFHQIPKASVHRALVEAEASGISPGSPEPRGLNRPVFLSQWDRTWRKTHWISSLLAFQIDFPIAAMEAYKANGKSADLNSADGSNVDHLLEKLLAAFLNDRPPRKIIDLFVNPKKYLDEGGPVLSFTPGAKMDTKSTYTTFMLGTWSAARNEPFTPPVDFLQDSVTPVTECVSNTPVISESSDNGDCAGAVLYWRSNKPSDSAALLYQWRAPDGGFEEFIVERVSDKTARLTYITSSCTNMYPRGQDTPDFKTLPRVTLDWKETVGEASLRSAARVMRQAMEQP